MEYLQKGYMLDIPGECFPLTTDSILLADFVRLPANASVLDLGSGCGTLGLLLCAKDANCTVTGIEIDPAAHSAAVENAKRNGLENRLQSLQGDLRDPPVGSYHCCVSNPPYYTAGPASARTPTARRDDHCQIPELFAAASRALRYGGDFFLVHKPERLAELCAWGTKSGLEAKRLCLVRNRADQDISLILLQFRKGGKPGLVLEEKFLRNADGTPSEYYKKIYHL